MSHVDAKLQYFNLVDDTKIYYHKWMPPKPKGIIIFVHGFADHVGRYGSLTRYFATRGYGVCLFDMRGHGKSGGKKTDVKQFFDYLHDLSQFIEFVKKSSPHAPIFLMGHSFGGQLVLNFIVKYNKGIRGVVVLSPSVEIKLEIPKWKLKFAEIANKWFPFIRLSHNIDPKLLSHDEKVVEEYDKDPNVQRNVTIRCGQEILKNSELVMAMASRIHLPIMLLHGGGDKICDPEATKKFFMRVPVYNKQLKIYPGLYHELLNETDKNQVFGDIEAWLENQLEIEYRIAGSGGRRGV